ncbi:MAG: hypothetical protein HYY23_04515, partial [Verrucomicrobia bacterium]|nr:hypothetical protein [Verrucomicrobiota bacterium]
MAKPGGARVILGFLLFGAVQGLAQNQVLDLDGQDSYVELPNNSFSDLEEATVEGWVKFQEFRRESRFCDFGTMGTGIYVTEVETTRTLRFVVQDKADVQTPDQKAEIENALRLGSWCHLAAVTGRSGMKLYVNGVLAGTAPHTGSFQSIGRNTNAIHNYLGRNNYRGFFRTEDFRGQMDEIRVWSTARTAEEIRANLFHRLTGNEPGLAGLWNFDEGTARDRSPHQRHGILAGNAKCVAADFPSSAQAPAPAVLFGRITDANGTPLRGVAVRLEENDSPIAEAMTDDRGDYRMAVYASAATYDLSATSGRKGDWRLGLQLKAAEWCRTDFALKEAARLSGRVRTMDTNVFQAAVVVQAIRYEPSWTKPAEGSQELNAYAAETQRTDANGRFQFVNLKPGQYRLRAHGNGQLTDYDQGTPLKVELGQSQP